MRRKRTDGARIKIQIAGSGRAGGKVRPRAPRHVGTARGPAEAEAPKGLGRLIMEELRVARAGAEPLFSVRELGELTGLARRAAENPRPAGVDIAECRHEGRVEAGVRQAFGAVYSGPRRAAAAGMDDKIVRAASAPALEMIAELRSGDTENGTFTAPSGTGGRIPPVTEMRRGSAQRQRPHRAGLAAEAARKCLSHLFRPPRSDS